MTRPTQLFAGIAVITLTALTLSACNSAGGGTGPETPVVNSATTATASKTPLSSPTSKSPKDTAAEHAEAVFRDYLRAQTTCFANPAKAKPTCFDDVSIATERTNMRNELATAQAAQTTVTGSLDLVSLTRKSVSLENKPKASPPVVPEVVFMACVDVSGYNIMDKDGKSVVPPSRKPRALAEVHVANYKYPDPAQWRVAFQVPQEDTAC